MVGHVSMDFWRNKIDTEHGAVAILLLSSYGVLSALWVLANYEKVPTTFSSTM